MKAIKDIDGTPIKIFRVDDCEWWFGKTKSAVKKAACANSGNKPHETEVEELSDEAAATLMFDYGSQDGESTDQKRPMIEQLRLACQGRITKPEAFAFSEY